MLGFLFGAGLFVALIVLFVGVLTYVWFSLALMTMAKNKGIPNPWLAFIPFANLFIVGLLIENLDLFGNKVNQPEIILPILGILSFLGTSIPVLGGLLSLILSVVQLIAIYQLIEKYKEGSGALYTILLVLLAPVGAYMMYSIRENRV